MPVAQVEIKQCEQGRDPRGGGKRIQMCPQIAANLITATKFPDAISGLATHSGYKNNLDKAK